MTSRGDFRGEVLFEFKKLRHLVKATAIDPRTRLEASIVLSPRLSSYDMKKLATRRLVILLKRRGLSLYEKGFSEEKKRDVRSGWNY